jgi:cytochrome c biogenesis protein CcmG/thiol:disulfide interchange protein DsbE
MDLARMPVPMQARPHESRVRRRLVAAAGLAPLLAAGPLPAAQEAIRPLDLQLGPGAQAQRPQRAAERLLGQEAPGFSFPSVGNGQRVALADFRGRPVLITFMGSWCGFCISETPALVEADRRHGERIAFVSIGVRERDGGQALRQYAQRFALRFPVLLGDDAIMESYRVQGTPMGFLVGTDGRILEVTFGRREPAQLERSLQRALRFARG